MPSNKCLKKTGKTSHKTAARLANRFKVSIYPMFFACEKSQIKDKSAISSKIDIAALSFMPDNARMNYPIQFTEQLKIHLRAQRVAKGLTQAELAERLGVVQSRIASIEKNPGAVSVEQFLRVLAALDMQCVLHEKPPNDEKTFSVRQAPSGW